MRAVSAAIGKFAFEFAYSPVALLCVTRPPPALSDPFGEWQAGAEFLAAPLSAIDLTRPARLKRRMTGTLEKLESTITARRNADPGSSYVASLFAKGMPKIAQKLGEEAVETVIAAMAGDAKGVTGEAADLLFHLTVLLAAAGVPLSDVMAELERREGTSGLAEKAARTE